MLPTPCYNAQGRVTVCFLFLFLLRQFCVIAKWGDDPHEDLARFDDKLNMKVNRVKHPFGYQLEPCTVVSRLST